MKRARIRDRWPGGKGHDRTPEWERVWPLLKGRTVAIVQAEWPEWNWPCEPARVYKVTDETAARVGGQPAPAGKGRYVCECMLVPADRERLRQQLEPVR